MKNLDTKRCPICQSSLKRNESDTTTIGKLVSYKCALFASEHYSFYFGNERMPVDEECVNININGKKYQINQYLDNNDVIIAVYDKNDNYICTSEFRDLSALAFDFLDGDMNKIINKLKVMLTFQ